MILQHALLLNERGIIVVVHLILVRQQAVARRDANVTVREATWFSAVRHGPEPLHENFNLT